MTQFQRTVLKFAKKMDVKALLALYASSLDTDLLIMESNRQILSCMLTYLEIRKSFQIAAYHLDYIIGPPEQL